MASNKPGLKKDMPQVVRQGEGAATDAPPPDDTRKPDSPTDISKPSWKFVLKNTLTEYSDDQCTDSAAALTYYAVLALFPAIIALISLIGIFGDPKTTVDKLMQIVSDVAPSSTQALQQPVQQLVAGSGKAGFALVIGILVALWSASGYIAAFSRVSNRIYEVEEGRPFYKLRPLQVLVTAVCVIAIAIVALALVVSGPVAKSIGDVVGLGNTAVLVFRIVKWPIMAIIVSGIIALLYWVAPNVQQPKFKWFSIGAIVALVTWVVASVIFGFYVANFSSYDKTYGTLAGVIVFLLWLWITNNAILFGAELNAELERGRELQAGMPAEEQIQLPPRDTKGIEKKEKKELKAVREAREIRERNGN